MDYVEKMLVTLIAVIIAIMTIGFCLLILHSWRIAEDKRNCRNNGGTVEQNAKEDEWYCKKEVMPEKVF